MLIKQAKVWDIRHRDVTPQKIYFSRRDILSGGGVAAGSIAVGAFAKPYAKDTPLDTTAERPTAALYPAERNSAFTLDRDVTPEEINLMYNNFYEFGSHKSIAKASQALRVVPWSITIDGEVERDITIDAATLIAKMGIEERLYRHRCVEAWSMTIPWSGFPLRKLVAFAKPLSSAKYVRMETFHDPQVASNQKQSWLPWPYVEALTMAEATNDLAFLACGAYGKPVAKQMGAPLRLAVPWKYGFKSIKSIVRFSFVRKRPVTFWEETGAGEYGFWANVNPEVPHSRWSQKSERVLHTRERVPTLLFNGYSEQVAHLYKDMKGDHLYR